MNQIDRDNSMNEFRRAELCQTIGLNLASWHCSQCGQDFTSQTDLIKHHASLHRGRKHVCHMCYRVFNSSSNMKAHMRIHTGEKPYKCDVCGKAFTQKAHMLHHKLTHKK